jgi:hypothetical protein
MSASDYYCLLGCDAVQCSSCYRETFLHHFLGKLIYLVHCCSMLLWNIRALLPDMESLPRRLRLHCDSHTDNTKAAYSQVNVSVEYHYGLSSITELSSRHTVLPDDTCVHIMRVLINGYNTSPGVRRNYNMASLAWASIHFQQITSD